MRHALPRRRGLHRAAPQGRAPRRHLRPDGGAEAGPGRPPRDHTDPYPRQHPRGRAARAEAEQLPRRHRAERRRLRRRRARPDHGRILRRRFSLAGGATRRARPRRTQGSRRGPGPEDRPRDLRPRQRQRLRLPRRRARRVELLARGRRAHPARPLQDPPRSTASASPFPARDKSGFGALSAAGGLLHYLTNELRRQLDHVHSLRLWQREGRRHPRRRHTPQSRDRRPASRGTGKHHAPLRRRPHRHRRRRTPPAPMAPCPLARHHRHPAPAKRRRLGPRQPGRARHVAGQPARNPRPRAPRRPPRAG